MYNNEITITRPPLGLKKSDLVVKAEPFHAKSSWPNIYQNQCGHSIELLFKGGFNSGTLLYLVKRLTLVLYIWF